MIGHTTQLGPHQNFDDNKQNAFSSRVKKGLQGSAKYFKNKEHLLIMIGLLSFTLNIGLVFEKYSPTMAMNSDNDTEVFAENDVDPFVEAPLDSMLGADESYQESAGINISDSIHYKVSKGGVPRTTSESYLVGDIETGEIISAKNPESKFPMASVTKLMTAVVSKENVNLRHMATVSKASYNTYGAQGQLQPGEKILVSDLLYPLLIESSNDAAEVIADDYGRGAFMSLMNKKAGELGMSNTYFEDPSGLSPNNRTNAKDLLKLSLYIERTHPDIFDITRVRQYEILRHKWINANQLLNFDNFLGGKNGYINEARRTTVSVFEVPFTVNYENGKKRIEKRKIVTILLRSEDRTRDVSTLLNYVRSRVSYTE